MYRFRTQTLNLGIEGVNGETNAGTVVIDLNDQQSVEENIYNDSVESFHYSVPMRGGRRLTLPAPPENDTDMSDGDDAVNNNNENKQDASSTACKIYETLTSSSSVSSYDSQPAVPKRPEWTLQVPDDCQIDGNSPLYLMMPQHDSSKPEVPGICNNDTLTNVPNNNSSKEARKSISDTAKKILQRFSKSFSSNPELHKTLCDESDSDSDNVFS